MSETTKEVMKGSKDRNVENTYIEEWEKEISGEAVRDIRKEACRAQSHPSRGKFHGEVAS